MFWSAASSSWRRGRRAHRNRTLGDRDPTAQAETAAIRRAAAAIGSERLSSTATSRDAGALPRARALSSSPTAGFYHPGAADPRGGAVESGVRFFSAPTCHHWPRHLWRHRRASSAALCAGFSRNGGEGSELELRRLRPPGDRSAPVFQDHPRRFGKILKKTHCAVPAMESGRRF